MRLSQSYDFGLSLSVCSLPIGFLSSAFLPVLATQPLFLPFLFLPVSASQWLPRCDPSAHASLAFPRSSQPGFPCLLSRFFVLGFLFVSFHPSRLRSHSCSTGASLLFRFRFSSGLSACFPVSFVPFSPLLTTQPSALSFPFFPFSPGSGSFGASFLFRPACFHAFLPIPVLGLLRFLSPFAVSLHSSYLNARPSSFRFPTSSPWLSL